VADALVLVNTYSPGVSLPPPAAKAATANASEPQNAIETTRANRLSKDTGLIWFLTNISP
jgi:hypothetical protein